MKIREKLITLFKERFFLRLIYRASRILPSFIVYQIFKNLIRVGLYNASYKTYLILNSRSLPKKLKEKFFISKVVFLETQLFLKKKIPNLKKEIEFLNFKKILNKKIKISLCEKERVKKITDSIITEFIFVDTMIPSINKFYELQFYLNFDNKETKIVSLDRWWFQAIGHFIYLDTFIKAVLLGIINVKKIYFDVTKKDISNLYLYKKYKKILIKNNLYQEKKIDGHKLNMRYWPIHKFNKNLSAYNVLEYIQKKLRFNDKINKKFYYDYEEKEFLKLKNKIGTKKKIITIHIRQPGFNPEDANGKIRNSNLLDTLESINEANDGSFYFILMGGDNMKKIGKKFPDIFDYSKSRLKSGKNDVLLMNNCDGHIGTTSGLTHLMLGTSIPALFINWCPFEYVLKNDLSIIVPKILKQKENIFSINDYHKFGARIFYNGIDRIKNLNVNYEDNSQDDIYHATKQFLRSLKTSRWKNYGIEYQIKPKNYTFNDIPLDIDRKILNIRDKIYFDPSFIKKYPSLI